MPWRENDYILYEHFSDAQDGCHEGVYFFACIVEGEACTTHALDAVARHERLCTVMSCAYGYTEAVEQGSEVEVMYAVDVEGADGVFRWRGAVKLEVWNLCEPLHGVCREVLFVLVDVLHAYCRQVVEGYGKCMCANVVGGASFKLEG